MEIKYEILSFNSDIGGVTVHYYTQSNPVGFTYNIDLPIENGSYPNEDAVIALVELYAPKGQLERIEAVKTAAVPAFLASKILPPTEESQNDTEQ